MLEIYTIAGGDWFRGNLNAIAAFMSTGTGPPLRKCVSPFPY